MASQVNTVKSVSKSTLQQCEVADEFHLLLSAGAPSSPASADAGGPLGLGLGRGVLAGRQDAGVWGGRVGRATVTYYIPLFF